MFDIAREKLAVTLKGINYETNEVKGQTKVKMTSKGQVWSDFFNVAGPRSALVRVFKKMPVRGPFWSAISKISLHQTFRSVDLCFRAEFIFDLG